MNCIRKYAAAQLVDYPAPYFVNVKVLLISYIFHLILFTQIQLYVYSPDTEFTHVHIVICIKVTFYMYEQLCET